MGAALSYPFAKCSDLENALESVTVKSISFGNDGVKTPVRSISFKTSDSEPTILKSVGSGKMILEGSISFKGSDFERMLSLRSSSSSDKLEDLHIKHVSSKREAMDIQSTSPVLDPSNPQHEAAIRLQKVYKSFRTRRKLADCAVLVEQSWWKLLDFAELKRSSIDPRHRYGHNLHFYYNQWLHSQSLEPFFYWLDIGEGKEVNLEKCPRSKLQQQCIKYLGPMERMPYEVVVVDGKFMYRQTGKLLHTTEETDDTKWIFVLSTSKVLYVGVKKKGTFQHSSFLAGGVTIAAGRLIVDNGVLKAVWPHSGHYRPTEENFNDFISFLRENNIDLTDVKMTPVDEEANLAGKRRSINHLRCNSSEEDFSLEMSKDDHGADMPSCNENPMDSPLGDDYERMDETGVEDVPKESILQRINSKKGMKSYQLGKQLSCKWTTGAGPRIGCVRDYPSGLQFRALEQVNLSPRSTSYLKTYCSPQSSCSPSPKVGIPAGGSEDMRTQSLPVGMKEKLLQRSIPSKRQSFPL
ncbi:Pentatricopeptide repeat-containing, mitochondrial -like protein [Gossypium arboreum]|uniref:Pentatricopeptide repeat-containing, mitochondrial-like protein n=1 Tax=Gossypium arboreum TaxID=29729 RepID=A0A0B0MPZ6_GOSAR|nr:Pentatricopeptide repeat-containing, mitochondrial -like protein [Gossypium arboreum]